MTLWTVENVPDPSNDQSAIAPLAAIRKVNKVAAMTMEPFRANVNENFKHFAQTN